MSNVHVWVRLQNSLRDRCKKCNLMKALTDNILGSRIEILWKERWISGRGLADFFYVFLETIFIINIHGFLMISEEE